MSRATKRRGQSARARAYREMQATCERSQTRESTAWHEAGHAVTFEYFDVPVEFVTCEAFVYQGKSFHGFTMGKGQDGEQLVVPIARGFYNLMASAAGVVSEWIHGTMGRDYCDPGDFERMQVGMTSMEFTQKDCEMLIGCAEDFLRFHWHVVEQVARLLIARGRIDGDELRQIVRARIGHVPEVNQTKMFAGLVVEPGTEADNREPWMRPVGMEFGQQLGYQVEP